MCKVQKVIEISSQLGSIEEFCKFVDSFHSITKCTEPNCPVGNLGSKLKKEMFDENLSYDQRRNFFLKFCVENLSVFWSIYKLQQKGKENLESIEGLINSQEITNEKQGGEALLGKLVAERQEIQNQIDQLLDKIYVD